MNTGRLIVLGIVGAAALGTLLVRVYRIENHLTGRSRMSQRASGGQPAARRRTQPDRADQPRAAVPPGRPIPRANIAQRNVMSQPISVPNDTAAHPKRVSRLFLSLPPAILLGLVVLALVLRGDYRIATTLGIVQGLGEPLPISSSAHLIVVPWLFGWTDADAFYNTQWYDVALHAGTLLAFVAFFWRDWLRLIASAHRPQTADGRLFWLLVLASVPGAAIGFVLDSVAEDFFRERYTIIAAALAIMGVALYAVDRLMPQRDQLDDIDWKHALTIGMAQSLAFIPGVSRSGSTMTMGRAMGLTRETAARFSFLMSMPITFGAVLLKLKDIEPAALQTAPFWLGIGVSFLVCALAIGFLLRYLKTNSFLPFVIYRLGLAALIVVLFFARRG